MFPGYKYEKMPTDLWIVLFCLAALASVTFSDFAFYFSRTKIH